jgi:glycosyltransferase involved in cell wall biosynthesis
MKILQIIDGRCCEAIADFVIQQSRALINLGEEVVVLDSFGNAEIGQIELNATERKLISSLSSIAQFPANIFRFAKFVARLNPDIVIVHQGESHFVAAFGIWKSGLKITLVRFRWDNRLRKGISLLARFVTNRHTCGIGASSERARQYISGQFKKAQVGIFYPGVDTNYYQPLTRNRKLEAKYHLTDENLVIGLIGRLEPIKGHRSFIEASKLISLRYPKARFLIAGEEGSVKIENLKTLTDKWRITDRFIFINKVEDIRKVYSLCDIGVIATIGYEPISRVLLEYMALGIPVIGTNINQTPDILSDWGRLFPPGDPVTLANNISELIEDGESRSKLGQKGLTAVSEYYTISKLGERSQAFFREMMNGKN